MVRVVKVEEEGGGDEKEGINRPMWVYRNGFHKPV